MSEPSYKLFRASALKGVAASKKKELNELTNHALNYIVSATTIFSDFPNYNTGYEVDDFEGEDDDDVYVPTVPEPPCIFTTQFVDPVLLANVDGEKLLKLVKGSKPHAATSLLDQKALSRALDAEVLQYRLKSSFDSKAKSRIYAYLELFAQRLLHPSKKPDVLDNTIEIIKDFPSLY